MLSNLIIEDIKKRTKDEIGAKTFSRPFHRIITIDSPDFFLNTGNDIYYLVNSIIDVPVEYKISISSVDNYIRLSRLDYMNRFYKINSFRNYIAVKTRNYDSFIPFKLEFLIIVPE